MLSIVYTVIILSLILSCFEIDDPVTRFSSPAKRKQPRNQYNGRWTKRCLPLQITRVQRPRFRRLDERTLVRV
jgi:hypothetical protein